MGGGAGSAGTNRYGMSPPWQCIPGWPRGRYARRKRLHHHTPLGRDRVDLRASTGERAEREGGELGGKREVARRVEACGRRTFFVAIPWQRRYDAARQAGHGWNETANGRGQSAGCGAAAREAVRPSAENARAPSATSPAACGMVSRYSARAMRAAPMVTSAIILAARSYLRGGCAGTQGRGHRADMAPCGS